MGTGAKDMKKRALPALLALLLMVLPVSAAAGIRFETDSLLPIGQGDQGSMVRRVQGRLIQLGFAYGLPDGQFGSQTAQAVRWAQRYLNKLGYSFTVDGKVDEALYQVLMAGAFPESDGALRQADQGDNVTRLQRRLLLLGYMNSVTGTYGSQTRAAVAAFQARNGLDSDGVAGPQTRRAIYASSALPAQSVEHPLLVYVSTAEQRVYVYRWTDQGYEGPARTFVCSTGKAGSPTITGIYQTQEHCGEWYWFNAYQVWAKYAIRIRGPYLFHSTLFSRRSDDSAQQSSIRALGQKASHGCIRMAVEDIYWLYQNTEKGFTTIIY